MTAAHAPTKQTLAAVDLSGPHSADWLALCHDLAQAYPHYQVWRGRGAERHATGTTDYNHILGAALKLGHKEINNDTYRAIIDAITQRAAQLYPSETTQPNKEPSMNINEQYPSKYLAAADIPEDSDLIVTIKDVAVETVGQGDKAESKPIVYFQEVKKGLLCNKTNAASISGLYGAETDNWTGKKVALFATEVDYQGKQTMAIRVRMKAPKAAAAPTPVSDNSKALRERFDALAIEAFEWGVEVPELAAGASAAEIIKAGKQLKDAIAAMKLQAEESAL